MKLLLITQRDFEFLGKDGVNVSGYICGGYTKDNTVVEFTTKVDHSRDVIKDALKYSDNDAIDVELETSIWGGKVKRREVIH